MNQPLVSIVVPVYNKVGLIRQTLESALVQSYTNTEIILVDDGSTDGSFKILQKYAKQYPEKITLIAQENQGVSRATNTGIEAAKGEYIQFLDADDLLSFEKIEKQVNLLQERSNRTLATCEWVTFSVDKDDFQHWDLEIFKDYAEPIEMLLDFYNRSEMMQPGVFLCSKALVDLAGPWDEKLTINQDGEFFCRVLLHCDKVIFEATQKVYYRKPGAKNVSQQKSYQASSSLLESYRCYEREVLKKEGSQRVREALAKNYLRFIYVTHPKFPDLVNSAEREFEKFEFNKAVRIGGPKFQQVTKWIGFMNAVRLKRFFQ